MSNLREIGLFVGEMGIETGNLFSHITHRSRNRFRAGIYEMAQPEPSDSETIERLVEGGSVPDDIFHNGASVDFYPEEDRFNLAVSDRNITGLEYDVLSYPWGIYGAHGHGTFMNQVIRNHSLLVDSRLESLMGRAGDKFDRYNFDLRLHYPQLLDKFIPYLGRVEGSTEIFISGQNWNSNEYVAQSYTDRPINALFTVDGHNGNSTPKAFSRFVGNLDLPDIHRVGVSLKNDLISGDFIQFLKDNGYYSLIYCVDTNRELLKFTAMGVSGITSNNPDVLRNSESARKEIKAKLGIS